MPVARSRLRSWLGLISWSTAISCRSSVSAGVVLGAWEGSSLPSSSSSSLSSVGTVLPASIASRRTRAFVLHPLHLHTCVAGAAGEGGQLEQLALA